MEDLQINDISNETGNIGQNQSADSLFQPSNSNAGNLDLTFIDTAMTPLASSTTEPEGSSTTTSKPTSYTEYWNKVSRGAPGLGIMARAAGGDDDGSDDDDGDSGRDHETIDEGIERSKRDTDRINERTRKENAARDRERAERERAKKDREREREEHEAEHSSGGETESSPSGSSSSGSGGGGGSSEYSNEADAAYSKSSEATSTAVKVRGEAEAAYNDYKETLANEKQAEATVRDITTKAQDAKELAQHTIDTFNEASQKLAEKENEIKNFGKEFLSGKSVDDSEVGNVTITDRSSGTVATAKEATVNGSGLFGKETVHVTAEGTTTIDGKEYRVVDVKGDAIGGTADGKYAVDNEGNVINMREGAAGSPANSETTKTVLEAAEKMRIAEEYNRLQTERRQLSADEAALQGPMNDAIAAYRQTQDELAKAQQELAQAQQAKQEALATATAAVNRLDQANAAAEKALNDYLEASSSGMKDVEDTGRRIEDEKIPIGDPEDNEDAADALIISDDTWSREIKEVPDPLKGTPIGDCLQEYYDIFNNYDSEINEDAYQHWWNEYVTYIKSIWGKSNKKEGFFRKIARTIKGTWSALKEVKSIFKGRTEGHIVEFGKRCLSLLLNTGVAIMTGGTSIPVQTSVTIVKQLWKNMKNEVVDSDLNQIMENPNSEGGEYEYYDTYKAIADDADAKWQLPSELGENYVAGKRSNNYSDYNYGLEGEDEQKGQLYSDEEIKDFITRVYRKSPTLYKLKIN